MISFNQTDNICIYYSFKLTNQTVLSESKETILYYKERNDWLQSKVNFIFEQYQCLLNSSSNVNKSNLIFSEFKNLVTQNANTITNKGNFTVEANITTRKILFYDGNWYSPFYMPNWNPYGVILYLQVDSNYQVVISKARTNMMDDIKINKNYIAMFVNDLTMWNFIGSMNKTLFLANFN